MKYTAEEIPNSRYTRLIDDQGQHQMTWPTPDTRELSWQLVHAPESLTEADRYVMASVLSAYFSVVNMSQRNRNGVCGALKSV